ncbi:uncharacterized protein CLUP02_15598 [Colletotrichum lupini]|uniref:Uncharacterized protein n=1 Tax=Colletotrichum lupini TaxID=145971 RepID=A0A9Q8WP67_9PEZI|nr:uncharacterized protein CLUP02_15598 [Colletotrichum lupini]UQC90067.1 hypothetical protein CLUP02_15598 [Colletotrichum lupini]
MVDVRSIGFHEMFTAWEMCGCGGGATLEVFFCGGDDSNGSKEGSLHWHSVPRSACACDTRQRTDKITNNLEFIISRSRLPGILGKQFLKDTYLPTGAKGTYLSAGSFVMGSHLSCFQSAASLSPTPPKQPAAPAPKPAKSSTPNPDKQP